MSQPAELYSQLAELCQSSGPGAVLDRVIEQLESEHRYHELFEALKMRSRMDLGLVPTQTNRDEQLDEDTELKIERALIEACRRVGEGFIQQGQVREGWMYLRPVGDKQLAATALSQVQPSDENLDALLEILVHEGVDVAAGYRLALDKMGTCNCITLFETAVAARPRRDQQAAAALLVKHVHRELLENVRRELARREGPGTAESSLALILAGRPTLLRDGSYHLDTTHLASTVRFARVLDEHDTLRLAYDLAQYGRHLHPQFQYPGEEPFIDLYPSSIAFFGALLGEQVDGGIRYFTQKADSVDRNSHGNIAVEVLIDLLSRTGRHAAAMAEFAKRIPPDARLMGIAPSLLELSERLGSFETMKQLCAQRHDLIGYTAALIQP